MHRWALALFSATLILGGCKNDNTGEAAVEKPKTNRPIVAVVPVVNLAKTDFTWDLSQELTEEIRSHLVENNGLYLINEESIGKIVQRLNNSHDPFGADLVWIKKVFSPNEFVVFMELVDHDEHPIYGGTKDSPSELSMVVKVRVIDLRSGTPQVVLQEVIEQSHHIPAQFTKTRFAQMGWKTDGFEFSPLGLAHDQLTREIGHRIEDYIHIAEKQ